MCTRQGRTHGALPQGERMFGVSARTRGSECEHGTTPQGCPNKGDHKPSWPSREPSHEVVLSTWEGPGRWGPRGKPPRSRPSGRDGLLGHGHRSGHRRPQQTRTSCAKSVMQHHHEEPTTHLTPIHLGQVIQLELQTRVLRITT